jgi:uncharacterized damage-inducible protein DinB
VQRKENILHSNELLKDAFTRVRELVHTAATGIDSAKLTYRPEPGANSIAWLVWHLTRIQDDHVSEIAGLEQAWVTDGWAQKFGMEPDPENDGRGHGPEQVAAIAPDDPELLIAHHNAVSDRTFRYLETVDASELDRIIDYSYDPPVSVGVRLVSVISDNIQHAGQARYLRGIVDRIL